MRIEKKHSHVVQPNVRRDVSLRPMGDLEREIEKIRQSELNGDKQRAARQSQANKAATTDPRLSEFVKIMQQHEIEQTPVFSFEERYVEKAKSLLRGATWDHYNTFSFDQWCWVVVADNRDYPAWAVTEEAHLIKVDHIFFRTASTVTRNQVKQRTHLDFTDKYSAGLAKEQYERIFLSPVKIVDDSNRYSVQQVLDSLLAPSAHTLISKGEPFSDNVD